MSERGSFVTQWIYCPDCLAAAKAVLADDLLCSVSPVSGQKELPIIAGRVQGLYSGEEMDVFEWELNPVIAKAICHPLRIAVIAEIGERVFTIAPDKGQE